jgi:hypothetical protein
MCYILCTSNSVCVALGTQGFGGSALEYCFYLGKRVAFLPHFLCCLDLRVHCWVVFRHMVFAVSFQFPVKELGLLTNPGHWVRVLDVTGSYMYIVL